MALNADQIDSLLGTLCQPAMEEYNYRCAGNFLREEGVTLRRLNHSFDRLAEWDYPLHIKSIVLAGFNGDN